MSDQGRRLTRQEAALLGLAEGATLGFSGEAYGRAQQVRELLRRMRGEQPQDIESVYELSKAEAQSRLREAEEQFPTEAYGAQLLGSLAVPIPGGTAANLAARAGQLKKAATLAAAGHAVTGAISGLGKSENTGLALGQDIASEALASAAAGGLAQRYGPEVAKRLRTSVVSSPWLQRRLGQQSERLGDISEKLSAKAATMVEPASNISHAEKPVDVFVVRDPATGQLRIVAQPKQTAENDAT